jgi:hypothetical protein
MSEFYGLVQKFYQNRSSLPADRHILKVLKQVQEELQPGNDLAKLTEMSLLNAPVSCHLIEKLSSVTLLQTSKKSMMFLALEEENGSVYDYLADMLSKKLDVHTDVFLHYPYSKDKTVTSKISNSYRAKYALALDEDGMSKKFPHVRFHYCDLRAELLPGETVQHLHNRVKLMDDYASYLVHHDIDHFTDQLFNSDLKEEDILELDGAVSKLEGKIMKSFYKAENKSLSEEMVNWFEKASAVCRRSITEAKTNIYEHPTIVSQYYLEYFKELNDLYHYSNTLYTMLRMFRSFKKVDFQNSDSPSHCIIVLPKQMVNCITDFLQKHIKPTYTYHTENSSAKINQCLLDDLFQKWKK